jgi:hypothetical protein
MRFLADENFNGDILDGVRAVVPNLDVVRVQDTEIYTMDDPIVLEWAANTNRILLTHDAKTVPKYANQRVQNGLPMPGVFLIKRMVSYGRVIDDLLMIYGASDPSEWENRVVFLPF